MARRVAYRKQKQNKAGMLLVTTVVLMMMVVVTVKSIELRQQRDSYKDREQQLLEEIAAEEARSDKIAEFEKYTQTKKYVEEIAKEKLGLVYEGEIIFKDEK